MDQNFFSQNPAFQNISPEKLAFLMNFMNQEKPNSSRDMMAFLMNFVAKSQKIRISRLPQTKPILLSSICARD